MVVSADLQISEELTTSCSVEQTLHFRWLDSN